MESKPTAASIMNLLRQGQVQAAEESLQQVLVRRPHSPLALTLMARIQRQRGDFPEAFATLRRARRIVRGYPPMLNEAGCLATAMGKHQMAVRWYRRLVRALPDQPDGYALLALAHQNAGNSAGALRNYRRALDRGAENTDHIHRQMAQLLLQLGQADEAAAIYEQQAVRAPDAVAPLYALADARVAQARFDEAIDLYREVLQRQPALIEVHQRIANARRFDDPDDRDIEAMRAARPASPLQREQINFALGKVLDDCGRHEEAFAHFKIANDLQQERVAAFDFDSFGALVDNIIDFFDQDWFGGMLEPGPLRAQPIFVVGMPRSGTSLVEQILASHPEVGAAGEQPFFTLLAARVLYPDVERLTERLREIGRWRKGYVATLIRAAGQMAFITDKFPGNFVNLGIIRTMFPDAPVIHCERDALDNGLSIYCHDFHGANAYGLDLRQIARYRQQYERLMQHWLAVLPTPVHSVVYEEITTDTAANVRALLEYCEIPWDDACLQSHSAATSVTSRSSWPLRQPIYQRSVGRWHAYEAELAPLRRTLDELAGASGNPA